MWSVRLPIFCRRKLINRTTNLHVCFTLKSANLLPVDRGKRYISQSVDSSLKSSNIGNNNTIDKMSLASNLASLVEESSVINERKPRTRLELKRFLESRIKKTVKSQFKDGKFHNLIENVIANPYTLQDAYDSIRVNSNINLLSESDNIPFDSLAQELSSVTFDITANTYSMSTKGSKREKEKLVLPNLKLTIIQEAIRIALEVVYKPHYSKISHGCRIGRGHVSALKYIRKEISNSDWFFTVEVNKKVDNSTLSNLISTMETKIQDPKLYSLIHTMFNAGVLNLEFGGFPKGYGLPQEGLLSPILINIYLDQFDREILNLSMKHEALCGQDSGSKSKSESESKSNLRGWFRRQMSQPGQQKNTSGIRVHCCRLMDEILVVVKGSKELSLTLKSEIESFLIESLYLEVKTNTDILSCSDPKGVRFSGIIVNKTVKEGPKTRAVHKLKEKIELFSLQKQEAWDQCMVRIGKKMLGHGYKKVKESEIKHLADCTSVLSQVSQFRKPGMETDHWYKQLLKIRIQDTKFKHETEESILSNLITENALPHDLKQSFYNFQNHVKNYISPESESESEPESESHSVTEVLAPITAIRKSLQRYGITNSGGHPCACHMLVLLDHNHIIDWFSGLVSRWIKWYHLCDNFNEIKSVITSKVKKSCIRTLATKYRIHESEIEKKFDSDLIRIWSNEENEENEEKGFGFNDGCYDEGMMYGVSYGGLCVVSFVRFVSESRGCGCFVIGCGEGAWGVYRVHVMKREKFPDLKTGFLSGVHGSLNGRRVGLCKEHLKDLFVGSISLQVVDFGAWK